MDPAASLSRVGETGLLRALRPDAEAGRTLAGACSRAAEHGGLWVGVTAVAATSRRTRRSGMEGLAAWAAASGAAFAVKGVVGRRRPRLVSSFGSAPSSSSMPSSHTAGAFGYATAAAMRTPSAGLVTIPLAVAVGWSRAATGRHFPTDVLVGGAVGVIAGSIVHVVGRHRDRHPAAASTKDELLG